MIQPILDATDQLRELQLQLLQSGEAKRQALTNNQVNEVAAIVSQENKLVKQVAVVEAEWRAAIVRYVRSRGFEPTPSMTAADIRNLIDNPEDRDKLQHAQERLLDAIRQVDNINTVNQQLIETSLAYIDYSIELMTDDAGQDAIYGNPAHGRTGNRTKPNARFNTWA